MFFFFCAKLVSEALVILCNGLRWVNVIKKAVIEGIRRLVLGVRRVVLPGWLAFFLG